MAGKFTPSAQNALKSALNLAREMGHTYIGTEHILLGLLAESDSVAARLAAKRGVTYEGTRLMTEQLSGTGEPSQIGPGDMTPRTKKVIEASAYEAVRYGQSYIGTEHILLALLSEPECVGGKLLSAQGVSLRELSGDIIGFFREFAEPGENPSEETVSLRETRSGAPKASRAGAALANCPLLRQYTRDLTALAAEGKLDPIIGREEETDRVIQILSRRTKNNPCLIGEPGVGKTAVVEGLAERIAAGRVPDMLAGQLILTLDLPGMIAGAKYRGEFEERMKGVMGEASKTPGVILFIDEIHTIVGAGSAEGAVDAANIIKPALARGELRVIGATTIAEYRRHLEKDAALERRFQAVMVGEPGPEESVAIIRGLREKYEAHHKVVITDEAIDAAVRLSRRYINDRFLPDKAIDLIDEAASRVRMNGFTQPPALKELEQECRLRTQEKEDAVRQQDFELAARLRDTERQTLAAYESALRDWQKQCGSMQLSIGFDDIADVVTLWTQIPVKKLAREEEERLLHLEELLERQVIGQREAVEAVARCIRRGRTGLKDPRRPMGSFIFSGPTGVGKTELSRALADILFGSPQTMIRIDMSEYMEKHSVSKLIGSPPGYVGYEEGGQLTEKVRTHPYSVVLFDEIEKAHPDVFNLLLQILDDGQLTDAQGRSVDFKNAVVIMTTNAGAEKIAPVRRGMGFADGEAAHSEEEERKALREDVMKSLRELFRPEFLNRVDEIILFRRLGENDLRAIAAILLREVSQRVEQLHIKLRFEEDAVAYLAERGSDPQYGARPLRRIIQREVEDEIASRLLDGRLRSGQRVVCVSRDGGLDFQPDPAPPSPARRSS